jgi:CRP-like cAMP-binding protein
MISETASAHLRYILEKWGERVHKPKSTVLFRRGHKTSGMFVVLSGKVSLDLGVDSALSRSYGAGALVGLPSTITRQNYSMTATVTEEAELGFWTPDALEALLHNQPDLCQLLLVILTTKLAESHDVEKTFVDREKADLVIAN